MAADFSNQIASSQTPVYNSANNYWSVSSYNKIDVNNDGEIQIIEAQAIKWLNVNNSNISDFTGIEAFTNLEYLDCGDNQITSLNVPGLTNLRYLNCRNNQLANLIVSGSTNLHTLNCYDNQLPNLNVSGLTNLQDLECGRNQLTYLNLKNGRSGYWIDLGFDNNPNLH